MVHIESRQRELDRIVNCKNHPNQIFTTKLACVAGARKGKGEGEIGRARNARREGEGKRKRLQRTHCLFRLSRSPANEKSPLVRF